MIKLSRLLKFLRGGDRGRRGTSIDKNLINQKWLEVEESVKMGGASHLKSAILEADKILDYTLKGKGFKGETMADRLRSAENKLSRESYKAAWHGHKLRNRLVHEMDADILHFEVKTGIDSFRRVLKELGVL